MSWTEVPSIALRARPFQRISEPALPASSTRVLPATCERNPPSILALASQ